MHQTRVMLVWDSGVISVFICMWFHSCVCLCVLVACMAAHLCDCVMCLCLSMCLSLRLFPLQFPSLFFIPFICSLQRLKDCFSLSLGLAQWLSDLTSTLHFYSSQPLCCLIHLSSHLHTGIKCWSCRSLGKSFIVTGVIRCAAAVCPSNQRHCLSSRGQHIDNNGMQRFLKSFLTK